MRRVSQTFMQAIVSWPSLITTACCEILKLRHWSKVGCTVEHVACLCRVASFPRLIFLSLAATKKSDIINICLGLCSVLMDSCYPKLVCHLSSYSFCLVNCNLPNHSIVSCKTGTLRFVCVSMHRRYLLPGMKLNSSQSCHRISRVITSKFQDRKSWSDVFCPVFPRVWFLQNTLITFQNIIIFRNSFGALLRRSLWYAHLSGFSGWTALAAARQFLVMVA